ncbi:hydroxyacylglutathione hydrolase [Tetragenococcus koreensis]|uniref:hydroxyacylglutathione hydrolase n=1 Tax=Tetragenococcus koreensis TaxID=290335 RepID=UPI001F2AF0A8|nr:hydroxyacylglutathione hydrolase [Tetragenococcus koreensis]MCF1586222.1 hydroxyacylglutathione hydrolase [Tetragenococcus koreensis]MCF1615791.1 hydroxyacylglutathione hydrolase [Tetragenococcus koreensis]MCF1620722.1 hydroxyacylglutathione hydrolase [Tetragenococcus koreensis]MCF1625595.1 hydroxyacylglutathione hydrolase [Tetragenococcus koreensis]MCF1630476.1 hydroxyacylglutathione hydrolase [Tetragenococcus koreensis]
MTVTALEALSDNYIWLYQKEQELVVIDPGEAKPVLDYLANHKDEHLSAILLTHNHADHTGGVKEIVAEHPDAAVYGPEECRAYAENIVHDGETIGLLGQDWEIISVPGHTNGHIAYLVDDKVFCGDALFMAGCGRVFTGDYQAQYETVNKFSQLADDVKVYAAHEYSETNLRFANEVDPSNSAVEEALRKVRQQREKNEPTLPSTIEVEKEVNPFMRANDFDEFVQLRNKRDGFN